jgi:superfamily II DNA or RNA helicase
MPADHSAIPHRASMAADLRPRPPVVDAPALLDRLEFHRQALALIPLAADRDPGVAILVLDPAKGSQKRLCTCASRDRRRTCPHLRELAQILTVLGFPDRSLFSFANLRESVWHRLALFMAEGRGDDLSGIRLVPAGGDDPRVTVFAANGSLLGCYASRGADLSRLVERCAAVPDRRRTPGRRQVLEMLRRMSLSEPERQMQEKGHRTRAMAFEASFWYHLAYHGFREWGAEGLRWRPFIDGESGQFQLLAQDPEGRSSVRLDVPRHRVKSLLRNFAKDLAGGGPALSPVPLDVVFDARLRADSRLEIAPQLRLVQQAGEYRTLAGIDLKRFQYGDLVYIPQLNILADMVDEESTVGIDVSRPSLIERAQIPFFLAAHRDEMDGGRVRVDPDHGALRILDRFERLRIEGDRLARDWCHLAVFYGFGSADVSLGEILAARRDGTRFIATAQGWVDTQAEAFDDLEELPHAGAGDEAPRDRLRFSPMDLLRLQALSAVPVEVLDREHRGGWITRLLAGRSEDPLPPLEGIISGLRDYQHRGVEWLWYLYHNRFGGLLCDEMGLGKTHQVMALVAVLAAAGCPQGPVLVVCPTSVLDHWARKMAVHVPGVRLAIHHGLERDLSRTLGQVDVVLTSYGVMLRDGPALGRETFGLAVYDEIQHLKNPQTKAHQVARKIRAAVKIGLTGTPLENCLADLKSLFDLVLPGYLGSDERFARRFSAPIEAGQDEARRLQLQRLIRPFLLRRLKSAVARELPQKIEDTLACRLSQDQVRLYRQALDRRRAALMDALRDPSAKIPYIHIFALLNLLKQICNHPAMLDGTEPGGRPWSSGKWDLFCDLLEDCLAGGQKVVVYTQYLKMIQLIQEHLAARRIAAAVLTGASRERGRIVARFQEDPDCRVFVGSLKAGGVGIDLTAASVVIHYDRWWNAAREDQATDRVHRIGQRRGVQVFKLITEGTLEEKIDAVISQKRRLMASVVRPDDPETLKIFSREELIGLLADPARPAAEEFPDP